MSLHDKFLEEKQKLAGIEHELCTYVAEASIGMFIHPDGMKIETRSPGGSGDVVHSIYLNKKQIHCLRDYIERVFYDGVKS